MTAANLSSPMVDSVPASADLSSNQFLFHAINTSGQLALATVRGQRVHGVLLDDPAAAGRAGQFCYGGRCAVIAGGTFQEGVALTTNSSGQAIQASLQTDIVIGTARESGTSGERTSMYVGVAGGYISDPAKVIFEKFNEYGAADQTSAVQADGTAADGTADVLNILYTRDTVFGYECMGTQTITFPPMVAGVGSVMGLNIAGDQTADDGWELYTHWVGAQGRPFIVGLDAAFFFRCEFSFADISGSDDFWVGFRRAEIAQGTWDNYNDAAAMGFDAMDGTLTIATIANGGGTTDTDTGDTCLNGVIYQFQINVSAAGVCTFQHDIAVQGTLAAPTTTFAFTFDDGDPVIPMVHILQGTDLTEVAPIYEWEVGYS